MRISFLAPLALLLSIGAADACATLNGEAAVKLSLLAEVNALRANAGLAPLAPSRKLEGIAKDHACDMAERGYFGHVSPEGRSLKNRVRTGDYRFKSAVENIAITPGADAARVVRMWRNSPSHMANIVRRDLREVGFGAGVGSKNILWVMVGGSRG